METWNSRVALRRLTTALVLTVWVVLSLASPTVEAQEKTTKCELQITAPSQGDNVGTRGKVQGTARIPAGSYLWVLNHVTDVRGKWWPQGEGAVSIAADGTWAVMADYGGAQDIGEDFEIVLIVVDEQGNTLLQQWVQKREETNKYPHTMGTGRVPPIAFPNAINDCLPVKIAVKKTSHD